MKIKRQLSGKILRTLQESMGLRLRAGSGGHRFVGIWHVMVKDRVFVRSWSVKEQGWYRTFLTEPQGSIQVGKHEAAVVPKRITNKAMRDAVDRAYLEKYNTPGARKYAKDLCSARSRATTMELQAAGGTRSTHNLESKSQTERKKEYRRRARQARK